MTRGKKIFFSVGLILLIGYLYNYSPRRIEFLGHYDKIFAHRVNSTEKLKSALNYFNGVELDLVFDITTHTFEVNHPPATSINLNFKTYLECIEVGKYPFLWLDIKNLNETTQDAILEKLNVLLESRNYSKNKVLIESRNPNALLKFREFGYKTSYYLPPKLYLKTEKELTSIINEIESIIKLHSNLGISTSIKDYDIIAQHFPDKTKYIWAISNAYNSQYKEVRTVLNDSTVKIVLSQFNAIKGNR